jgi:hypothetical protein
MHNLLIAGLFLFIVGHVQADDAAKAIVTKALASTGWDKSKATAITWKDTGSMTLSGQKLDYTADWIVDRPGKYRFSMAMVYAGEKIELVATINGDKAWESAKGMTRDVTGPKLEYMKHEMHQFNVIALKPLLEDPAMTLKATGEVAIGEVKCTGITVSKPGHSEINLYFDMSTHLPYKLTGTVKDEFQDWKAVPEEVFFSDWKDIAGTKRFGRMKIVRDGKSMLESVLSDVKEPDTIDAKVFEKP